MSNKPNPAKDPPCPKCGGHNWRADGDWDDRTGEQTAAYMSCRDCGHADSIDWKPSAVNEQPVASMADLAEQRRQWLQEAATVLGCDRLQDVAGKADCLKLERDHMESMMLASQATLAEYSSRLVDRDEEIERLRASVAKQPVVSLQALNDVGLNPFACVMVAESLLKHPKPDKVAFVLPISRTDCPGWSGVVFRLQPVPAKAKDRFVWIPEAPEHPGLYANKDGTDLDSGKIRGEKQPSTRDAHHALHFATREECQAWCDAHPVPRFVPVEHGFGE